MTTVVPDLATALPTISNGGKTYTVTIRTGAMWDTSPPRQVTAADALLGLKRSCNPTQPFGGLPDFEALVVGYQQFCDGFAKVSSTSVSAIKKYIDTHQISGVKVSGQTITYNLVHPASYFADMLQLDAFAPGPGGEPELPAGQRGGRPAHDRRRAVQDPELRADPEHRLRPQPGVEGQHGPDPQGLRERDQGLGDREPGVRPAAAADQHGLGEHGVRRVPAGRRGPRPGRPDEAGAEPQLQPRLHLLDQPVPRLQHGVAEQRRAR